MKKFCGICEAKAPFEVKPVEIKVGTQIFKTDAEVCGKCGGYLVTQKMRKGIDQWGKGSRKNNFTFWRAAWG